MGFWTKVFISGESMTIQWHRIIINASVCLFKIISISYLFHSSAVKNLCVNLGITSASARSTLAWIIYIITLQHILHKQGVQSSGAKITQGYDNMRFIPSLIHYFNFVQSLLIFSCPLRHCFEDIVHRRYTHLCKDFACNKKLTLRPFWMRLHYIVAECLTCVHY